MFENFILEKLLRDLYVDDLATCFNDGKLVFSFYENSKKILASEGFDLCKWFTNSRQLRERFVKEKTIDPLTQKLQKRY